MILVEVIELVINVDSSRNFRNVLERSRALFAPIDNWRLHSWVSMCTNFTNVVVPEVYLGDPVAHNLQHYTDGQENDREHTEGQHCAHWSWNWPPSWQGLLLEL